LTQVAGARQLGTPPSVEQAVPSAAGAKQFPANWLVKPQEPPSTQATTVNGARLTSPHWPPVPVKPICVQWVPLQTRPAPAAQISGFWNVHAVPAVLEGVWQVLRAVSQ
jgi:hypothetical protein